MMHTPANATSRHSRSGPRTFNVEPILAALIAVGLSDQAMAIDTVWFGGSGDWEIGSNWSLGQPIGGDVAVIDNGTSTVNFDTSILGLMLTGGTIAGTGDLTLTGDSTWSGGIISGGAATTFNGSLALTGSDRKIIQNGRAVTATGATTWSGNTANNNGQFEINSNSSFTNLGSFTESNAFDSHIDGGGAFNNAGTYTKLSNTLTTVDPDFNNTGTVNVNAGTLHIDRAFTNQGWIQVDAGAIFLGDDATFINAGTLTGDGTVATHADDDVVNQGAINPGAAIGQLTLAGDLTQQAAGVLNLDLASLLSFDILAVTDDVTLDGIIVVHNAGYAPIVGDTFLVLTFDQRLGGSAFDAVTTQGYGSGVVFEAIYNAHDVTLRVAAVPEPETWAMLLAGLGLVGFRMMRRQAALAAGGAP